MKLKINSLSICEHFLSMKLQILCREMMGLTFLHVGPVDDPGFGGDHTLFKKVRNLNSLLIPLVTKREKKCIKKNTPFKNKKKVQLYFDILSLSYQRWNNNLDL